jgi:DNA-binding CsgD family transcriptional regulator/PAS domain-containing protein
MSVMGERRSGDDFAQQVAAIYEAALSPAGWQAVLDGFYAKFNLSFAVSALYPMDRSRVSTISVGVDTAGYRAFLDKYFRDNQFSTETQTRTAGQVVPSRSFIPPADFRRSQMYQEFHRPRQMGEGLRMDISLAGGIYHSIAFFRPWEAGPYESRELELCQALMPHLQRADAVSRRLRQADLLAQSAFAALDTLRHGVLLLDDQGRLLHANAMGHAVLATARGLDTKFGCLRATHPRSAARLDAALAQASGQKDGIPSTVAVPVDTGDGAPPLALLVIPFTAEADWYLPQRPSILVCVTEPAAAAIPPGHLMDLFGLTPAEAGLANDLLAGLDLRDVAGRTGRSVNTIRAHLSRLLGKTGVHRQSALLSLLARLPSSGRTP